MECPSCGEEVDDDSQFCRFCGNDLAILPEDSDLKSELQSMDDYEFEHFVADLWEEMGWNCDVSTASNDKGVDVRATKKEPYQQKILIQAKRYGEGNKVGSPAIQQYASLKHQENNVDKVVVVTTSSYSSNAGELANDLNVKLIDGDDLVGLVDQEEAHELVAEYIDFSSDTAEEDPPEESVTVEREYDQQDRSTVERRTDSPPVPEDSGGVQLPDTIWKSGVIASTVGIWIVVFGIDTFPSLIIDPLLLLTWIGLPVCIYKDAKTTREVVEWPQRWKWYVGIAVIPAMGFFVGPIYLLVRFTVQKGYIGVRRRKTSQDESSPHEDRLEESYTDPVVEFDIGHYTDAMEYVKELKREGDHDTAVELLLWCIDQAEDEAKKERYSEVPRGYYRHLAIIYRKEGRYTDEQRILERYINTCNELGGEPHEEIIDRLDRARELAA